MLPISLEFDTTVRRYLGDSSLSTPDFFRSRLDQMIDMRHPLAVLARRLPCDATQIARHKVVRAAKRVGISLKQTHAQEGKTLRRKAGAYGQAKQFRRQRTILGVVMREVQRKLDADTAVVATGGASALSGSPQAIEPMIGHTKADHRMDRWLAAR